jgi:CheY-like chemotaxis protein
VGSRFSFTITLPAARSEALPAAPRPVLGLAPGQRPPRLLVVDDVEDNRALVRDIFRSLGLAVTCAADGREALEKWEAEAPDLVWMDLIMPAMDGVEAAGRIRTREAELGRKRTVLIALTASAMSLDTERLLRAGFDDWVLKPIQETILFQKLVAHTGLILATAPDGAPAAAAVDAAPLRDQDPAWTGAFQRALTLGDTRQMLLLLDRLPDPRLAGALRAMVQEYRYENLKSLLEGSQSHA